MLNQLMPLENAIDTLKRIDSSPLFSGTVRDFLKSWIEQSIAFLNHPQLETLATPNAFIFTHSSDAFRRTTSNAKNRTLFLTEYEGTINVGLSRELPLEKNTPIGSSWTVNFQVDPDTLRVLPVIKSQPFHIVYSEGYDGSDSFSDQYFLGIENRCLFKGHRSMNEYPIKRLGLEKVTFFSPEE